MEKNEFDGEISLSSIEVRSGIYFLYNRNELVYIGKATNLLKRVLDHVTEGTKEFDMVRYKLVPADMLNDVELLLIKTLKPTLNISGRNSVSTTRDQRASYNKSTISIRPCVFGHYVKSDGTRPVKLRISYKRRTFYLPTNLVTYEEDVDGINIKNQQILDDANRLVKKLREATKFIATDKPFEYVKQKLTSINY